MNRNRFKELDEMASEIAFKEKALKLIIANRVAPEFLTQTLNNPQRLRLEFLTSRKNEEESFASRR